MELKHCQSNKWLSIIRIMLMIILWIIILLVWHREASAHNNKKIIKVLKIIIDIQESIKIKIKNY